MSSIFGMGGFNVHFDSCQDLWLIPHALRINILNIFLMADFFFDQGGCAVFFWLVHCRHLCFGSEASVFILILFNHSQWFLQPSGAINLSLTIMATFFSNGWYVADRGRNAMFFWRAHSVLILTLLKHFDWFFKPSNATNLSSATLSTIIFKWSIFFFDRGGGAIFVDLFIADVLGTRGFSSHLETLEALWEIPQSLRCNKLVIGNIVNDFFFTGRSLLLLSLWGLVPQFLDTTFSAC